MYGSTYTISTKQTSCTRKNDVRTVKGACWSESMQGSAPEAPNFSSVLLLT